MRRGAAAFALVPFIGFALLLWALAPSRPGPAAPRPPFVPGVESGSSLQFEDEVPVLRLAGSPREQGLAQGRLLRDSIREWVARVRPAEPGTAEFAIKTCGERLLPFVPPELREEMLGIGEGAGVDPLAVLHLNTRFDLAPFGQGRDPGATPLLLGPAAVQAGAAVRVFGSADLDGLPEHLLVVLRPDGSALLALPGMVGCFLGLRHGAAAALRPMNLTSGASLNGLSWPILLRVLLASPPEPGQPLPHPVTLPASIPLASAGGLVGTLNIAPGGAAYYPALAGMADATEEEAAVAPGPVQRILRGEPDAGVRHLEASALLRGRIEAYDLAARFDATQGGLEVLFRRHGQTHAARLASP
ncbi:MAG: hypothetical protein ACT4PV_09590 [Planctomycetaceae bacterium]